MTAITPPSRGPVTVRPMRGQMVPPIASAFERARATVDLFGGKRERNSVWIAAAQAMGQDFIERFLPKRLDRSYATSTLGYPIGGAVPFVDSGDTMTAVLARAYAFARIAQGSGPYTIIRLMAPAAVNQWPLVSAGLKTVPQVEVRALAVTFAKAVDAIGRGANRRTIQRGPTAGRARLSLASPSTAAGLAQRAIPRTSARARARARLASLTQ